MGALSVLLTTEGTYPYHKGGVSTWCDALTRQLGEVDFTILALTMHPYLEPSYQMQPNVRQLVTIPLWGIEQPNEFRFESLFSEGIQKRWRTTDAAIEAGFVPAFRQFLRGICGPAGALDPIGTSILAMHEYFQEFDYDTTMRSEQTWGVLVAAFSQSGLPTNAHEPPPATAEMVSSMRLLYHILQPVGVPVPRCDVAHSSAAAFCGLPCIIAKLKYGVPFLLTEHGVYVREQYLALRRSIRSPFTRRFMRSVVNLVAMLNYHYADLVAPVCAYNARWEEWWGVPKSRIRVIFNGADPQRFRPGAAVTAKRPVVSNIGLIYPLKGQLDLIAAAAYVREQVPDVEFRLYGEASDAVYLAACQQSVADKNLQNTVRFCGQTSEPWRALREADVVVSASVSEAFPYSIIEAMLTGAAIVATDVGGVGEALAGAGVVIPPRQPQQLAAALVPLLHAPARRRELGEAARARALQQFTVQTFAAAYRQAYQDLHSRTVSSLAQAS